MVSNSSSAIEFERKFAYTVETEPVLLQCGAKLIKEELLEDIYYDTEDYVMASHDYWLRRRNGRWELKYRPDSNNGNGEKGSEVILKYREEYDESRISDLVSSVLVSAGASVDQLNCLVTDSGYDQFRVLAAYTSHRKKYLIDNLVVDLDETDFGFRVGEIELLVVDEHHVTELYEGHDEVSHVARSRINSLASTLGISKQKVSGKMENYLAVNNQKLYQKLVEKNILAAI